MFEHVMYVGCVKEMSSVFEGKKVFRDTNMVQQAQTEVYLQIDFHKAKEEERTKKTQQDPRPLQLIFLIYLVATPCTVGLNSHGSFDLWVTRMSAMLHGAKRYPEKEAGNM